MEGKVILENVLYEDGNGTRHTLRLYENREIYLSLSHFGSTPLLVPLDRATMKQFATFVPAPEKPRPVAGLGNPTVKKGR